jgi:hypothetical protein
MTTPDTLERLRRGARNNDNAYRAGLELLVWLGKGIPAADAWSDPAAAYVDVDELERRAGAWSGGERRIAAVALSLLAPEHPVDLSWVLDGQLGGAHLRAVADALVAAIP